MRIRMAATDCHLTPVVFRGSNKSLFFGWNELVGFREMLEWCDVVVRTEGDRIVLENSALFFIPSALTVCNSRQLTVSGINSLTRSAKLSRPDAHFAGRSAIDKVMNCVPVVYRSALGFLNSANHALESNGAPERLSHADIVACVFRLRDAAKITNELKVTESEIARSCNIAPRIVNAALNQYRIQYVDAHAIWKFCVDRVRSESIKLGPELADTLTKNETDLIVSDSKKKSSMAIKRVGSKDDTDDYVYDRETLRAAPLSGHAWARA